MAEIVLSTLNAKYIHPDIGLRYLLANLGPLRPRARILEFDLKAPPERVVEAVLAEDPSIVGLGVYIWNVSPLTEVVHLLKTRRPDVCVVLGGPEVSYETEEQEICRRADHVIAGEADFAFSEFCREWLDGRRPPGRVIRAEPADVSALELPYDLYSDDDLAHRITYVETSRGCPFECEYCVSSNAVPVRYFDLPRVFESLDVLLARGARRFKFLDRTFNLNADHAVSVLGFFRERLQPGLFLHFEMMPDLFPTRLREALREFPAGMVQLEIGVQTFHEDVARRIRRKQDLAKAEESFRFLRSETGVLIHADLIAGLPGESLEHFAAGFDRLVGLRPQKIQVGILKRLRGCAIGRHDGEWGMVYAADPPYELMESRLIDHATMDRIKRFARHWELIANRGRFEETLPAILGHTPFQSFLRLSDGLFARFGRDYGIALNDLADGILAWLAGEQGLDPAAAASAIARDYARAGRRDLPKAVRSTATAAD